MTAVSMAGEILKLKLQMQYDLKADRLRRYEAQRYELKHRIPVSYMEAIREIVDPYVKHDEHCDSRPLNRYTVRSIYYDTQDLRFYFEKMASEKIRKKIRIRTYNLPEDKAPAFLEIKRKFNRLGAKERLCLPLDVVDSAVNGNDPEEIVAGRPFTERRMLDRFRFNLRVHSLRPVVLVAYEREAFIGRDNERVRVTLDQNIRSLSNPSLDQVFEDEILRQWETDYFVLELKFDDAMPRWMAHLIRRLNLRSHAYSKYCYGIDAWRRIPQ